MGIVNVTPDSFSDGGATLDPADAVAAARAQAAAGAAIVDVGGESTRPGADAVPLDEELRRVVPVLERLAGEVPLSIDTAKAEVARRALAARRRARERRHARCAATRPWPRLSRPRALPSASCTCRASRGRCSATRATATWPRTWRRSSRSGCAAAVDAGIDEERVCLDPGHRLRQDRRAQLRARAPPRRAARARPAGRRRLLAQELARPDPRRPGRHDRARSRRASRAAVAAYERGATVLRVHDVREHVEALAVARAVYAA